MSRLLRIVFVAVSLVALVAPKQTVAQDKVVEALKTIDPEILQYFPRWRICEPDLQIQIRQTFALMGFDPAHLDQTNIVITSAPIKEGLSEPEYDLILVECGTERMVASEIATNMRKLSFKISDPKRPYCYIDIPPTEPPSAPQADEIINYMEPTNVTHAFTLSAFDQTLKVGKSGFWLKAGMGTDQIGYHYWSSGEARVQLQRPLYTNTDADTRRAIPFLMNARLGFGYRLTGALDGQDRLLSFIPGRKLNAGSGGKLVGGIDFHLPMHPQFGVSVNLELPMKGISPDDAVDGKTYYKEDIGNRRITAPGFAYDPYATAPILRSTGQATLFYNIWLGSKGPENFFRFDLGMSYAEIREAAIFKDTLQGSPTQGAEFLAVDGVNGLHLWHPITFLDWVYVKAEYRNQGSFPFGISVQYSNQMLLGRAYIPILGDWLLLEGKYSTSLRADPDPKDPNDRPRTFELGNFFMVSPVLRLNF